VAKVLGRGDNYKAPELEKKGEETHYNVIRAQGGFINKNKRSEKNQFTAESFKGLFEQEAGEKEPKYFWKFHRSKKGARDSGDMY